MSDLEARLARLEALAEAAPAGPYVVATGGEKTNAPWTCLSLGNGEPLDPDEPATAAYLAALPPELVKAAAQALRAGMVLAAAEAALEHKPADGGGWGYTDGTKFSEDEHSQRLVAWENALDAHAAALAALGPLLPEGDADGR